jgi:hypothetical protein
LKQIITWRRPTLSKADCLASLKLAIGSQIDDDDDDDDDLLSID